MTVTVICPVCSVLNAPGANFCSACGAALPEVDEVATGSLPGHRCRRRGRRRGGPAHRHPGRHRRRHGSRSPTTRSRIGRHPDSSIFLDDVTVSRRHATVTRDASGQYTLQRRGFAERHLPGRRADRARHAARGRPGPGRHASAWCSSSARSGVRHERRADTSGHLSIGEVLSLVQDDFPDVTISKIRFLESQGLIAPERTASGYRKFYDADIERLRWILAQQRDHFLPLKVIKKMLDQGVDVADPSQVQPSLFSSPDDGAVWPADEPDRAPAGGDRRRGPPRTRSRRNSMRRSPPRGPVATAEPADTGRRARASATCDP